MYCVPPFADNQEEYGEILSGGDGGKQKVCSFLIQITDLLNKRGYLSPLLRWLNNASPLHKLLRRFAAVMV